MDIRPVMTVRFSPAVNRKQSYGVWHSKEIMIIKTIIYIL